MYKDFCTYCLNFSSLLTQQQKISIAHSCQFHESWVGRNNHDGDALWPCSPRHMHQKQPKLMNESLHENDNIDRLQHYDGNFIKGWSYKRRYPLRHFFLQNCKWGGVQKK